MSVVLANEVEIIAEILAGDTGEFRKLVDRYRLPVFRFASNLIRDEHDAEDITQDVFVAAFNHLTSYESGRATLLTWLLTIARNRCVNYLKRKRPIIDATIGDSERETTTNESERHEFWRCLDEALESLPVEQRTAFVLAEIEELPYADIAHVEQTTLGTVKSRIYRAKQRLRAVMASTLGEK